MGREMPDPLVAEGEIEVLARVFLADRQASFELHPERLRPVLVVGQEISAHPVVVQLHAIEAVVS